MVALVEKFEKQPADVQDYDIVFVDYLEPQADTIASFVVASTPGITILTSVLVGTDTVKVWISGGVSGQKYKFTVLITTHGGRKHEADCELRVKEV